MKLYRPRAEKINRGVRLSRRDFAVARACEGKRAYLLWADAEAEVQRIVEMNIQDGMPIKSARLGSYRCEYCQNWHVGHGRGPEAR